MFGKLVVSVVACLALANGNPAAGKEWTWKSRMPVVDPITGNISHPESTTRIVGGTEATPHAWPHQVGLFFSGGSFCSGSLISAEWVLTAGHCTEGALSVEVVMGAHNILENEATQVTMTSTHLITHEDYSSYTLANDIGLVKLPSAVTFNENIYSVALSHADLEVGTIVTLTGWGKDSDSGSYPVSNLRQVDNPVMSVAECDSVYAIVSEKMICTDTTGGKGTCNGDAGGPMNYNGMIYGVTSFGASVGCEAGYPAVFTRVVEYLDWIAAQTGIN